MKIVCDNCGAKYSIADDKVQGKVFKIRCKKCSEVIVVKGTAEGSEEGGGEFGSAYGNTGGASEWYVVIDGDRVGPITPEEVEAYFTAGQVHPDTFAWRDGLDDWVMLSTLNEFAHLMQDAAGPNDATMIASAHNPLPATDLDATAAINSGRFDSLEGYSDNSASVESGSYDQQPSIESYSDNGYGGGGYDDGYDAGGYDAGGYDDGFGGGEGGMFAAFDSTPPEDDYAGGYGAEEPEPAAAPASGDMVGARNENSVLFSLSSVDQVKAVSKPAEGAAQGNDKSGLIDIQALASTHASMKGDKSSDDDFAPGTMSMPALMPMGSHRKQNKGLMIGVIAGVAILALALVVVVVVLLGKDGGDQPAQPAVAAAPAAAPAAAEAAPTPEEQKEAEEAKAAAEAAMAAANDKGSEEEAEDEAAAEEDEKEEARAEAPARKERASSRTSTRRSEPAPEPTRTASRTTGSSGGGVDSIIGQLDRSGSSSSSSGGSAPAAAKDVPDSLSRSQVAGTIRKYNSQIASCARDSNSGGLSGTARVRFAVQPAGNVTGASVQGGPMAGTDLGGCIERVVNSMRFPESKSDLPITYPFVIR
ncbi:DUF4339 domain-containing protein [Lujinxingia sediminis]|uniref:DUF4339 domain-containing protein n=1 Tax=Lujinxingia sediminis TaxID=2480984 RepID=A0ABY0CZA5_9DELT|nr:GYF domain-containing protein [Lujinxingia sediminis]RVU48964.1 DUF4339 domain-containing protein [Lujinxingia sediminis]